MAKQPLAKPVMGSRQAADAFADSVGENRENVRVIDPKWKDLLGAVALVELHAECAKVETVLTLSDLGITAKDEAESKALSSVLSLGTRYLLPKRIVREGTYWRNQFRQALYRRSLKSHWGHLVPQQQYQSWKAASEKARAGYYTWANETVAKWDDLMAEVEADYAAIGWRNYRVLCQQGVLVNDGHGTPWVAAFVKRMMRQTISAEQFLYEAKMWWDVGYIPLKSMLATDEAEAVHAQALAQAKTEMEKDILNDAKQQFENGLFQFVSDVRGEVAERVYNVTADVLEAIEKNKGELPRNSTKQLRNLIEAVNDLKFWDDETLDAQMDNIRKLCNSKGRSEQELTSVLRNIGTEARVLMTELERPIGRQSRHLGDMVEDEAIVSNRAQRSLSVLDDDEPAIQSHRQARRLVLA
jgi:gas vesicle protein